MATDVDGLVRMVVTSPSSNRRRRPVVAETALPTRRQDSIVTEYTTVSIPKELAERAEETIEGTSFSSTSDLVRFLLRSIVIQHQRSGQLTEAEFEEITAQLKGLGYLE